MSAKQINLTAMKGKTIAIDGPAGSGKSTTATALAAQLGYLYLDTGAMYRALTWLALEKKVDPGDGEALAALAQKVPIEFVSEPEQLQEVFIDGKNVTKEIRTPEITRHVSEVAAHPGVREAMVARQKKLASRGSVVAEGRDTTTVVFPKADLKIYLDASVEQRARRRLLDMALQGVETDLEEQKADIIRRDEHDSNRAHSPLRRARDAIVVNTTEMTIEQQVDHIITLMRSIFK
jgi:cytidylate kinase